MTHTQWDTRASEDDLVEALKAAHDELATIHGMYGDYENSLAHSRALRMSRAALAAYEVGE